MTSTTLRPCPVHSRASFRAQGVIPAATPRLVRHYYQGGEQQGPLQASLSNTDAIARVHKGKPGEQPQPPPLPLPAPATLHRSAGSGQFQHPGAHRSLAGKTLADFVILLQSAGLMSVWIPIWYQYGYRA